MATTIPGTVRGGTLGIEAKATLDGTTGNIEVIWSIPPRIGIITIQNKVVSAGNINVYGTCSLTSDVEAGNIDWFDLFGAAQAADFQVPIHGAVSAIKVVRNTGSHRVCIRGQ